MSVPASRQPAAAPKTMPAPEEQSLGELIGRMSSDLGALFRQEIELAKVELKEEVTKAGKGAGLFGGGGFAGYMALVLLSFAACWGLAEVVPVGVAFLVIGLVYAAVAAVLLIRGRDQWKSIHGPQQTVETVKEDVQWAREQMS